MFSACLRRCVVVARLDVRLTASAIAASRQVGQQRLDAGRVMPRSRASRGSRAQDHELVDQLADVEADATRVDAVLTRDLASSDFSARPSRNLPAIARGAATSTSPAR